VRVSLSHITVLAAVLAIPASAHASLWEDATAATIGTTGEWSNKVELADVNGDGRVDILFANGGNYSSPGSPEANRVFLNNGPGAEFTEATQIIGAADLSRVIKVRDIDGDGDADIIVGTTYQTQTRLFVGDGAGGFTEVTATQLPARVASVGDLEVGDVDGDGDLDLVLVDWGPGSPLSNSGGRTMLWLNDGTGTFSDATSANMPDIAVRFSWDLELADVDNDYDLDILISCKVCTGSYLFRNDGAGVFAHDPAALPQFTNNYEFEPMDLDGDGFLDLVTINDGPNLREHVFRGDGTGGFLDATTTLWNPTDNVGEDDNMVVFLDVDSDGDADFLIGSLSGEDRLMLNDGTGHLTSGGSPFSGGAGTPGTLAIQVADLNGDGRLDVVQSQGELATPDRVFFGVDIAPDTSPPSISMVESIARIGLGETTAIRARVHDFKTPVMAHDWQRVELRVGSAPPVAMTWYGGALWRGALSADALGVVTYQVCATDAAGNEACSPAQTLEVDADEDGPDAGPGPNDPGPGGDDAGGCGCGTQGSGGAATLLFVLCALIAVRRRTR
jgi:hypothetical protein